MTWCLVFHCPDKSCAGPTLPVNHHFQGSKGTLLSFRRCVLVGDGVGGVAYFPKMLPSQWRQCSAPGMIPLDSLHSSTPHLCHPPGREGLGAWVWKEKKLGRNHWNPLGSALPCRKSHRTGHLVQFCHRGLSEMPYSGIQCLEGRVANTVVSLQLQFSLCQWPSGPLCPTIYLCLWLSWFRAQVRMWERECDSLAPLKPLNILGPLFILFFFNFFIFFIFFYL